jgi:hypothetical protein
MTQRDFSLGVALAIALLSDPSLADYLRASRNAHVYQGPGRTTESLATLSEGDEVALLSPDKQNGYYEVRSPTGGPGFVYKTLVRRFPGDLPSEGPEPAPPEPAPLLPPAVRITAERVTLARQLDRPALAQGQYRVYMFDVGMQGSPKAVEAAVYFLKSTSNGRARTRAFP